MRAKYIPDPELPVLVYCPAMANAANDLTGPARTVLTANQIRGFWASWGGWTLDGMDSFIYALVLVPSLRDLLPRSGIPATKGNIGYYGGLLFALFLVGWGLAFLWGPVGDKFGRHRSVVMEKCAEGYPFKKRRASSVESSV